MSEPPVDMRAVEFLLRTQGLTNIVVSKRLTVDGLPPPVSQGKIRQGARKAELRRRGR